MANNNNNNNNNNNSLKEGNQLIKLNIIYCPICSLPSEYCEYGPCYEQCLPHIQQNYPHLLSSSSSSSNNNNTSTITTNTTNRTENNNNNLEDNLNKLEINEENNEGNDNEEDDEKKKKKRSAPKLKKAPAEVETKVLIAKIQRQKRKYVTVVGGLETVHGLKIKDASKLFGKKFSSGASINEAPNGSKEVVIQGDVSFELPQLLISQFNILPTAIYFVEGTTLTPYQS